MISLNQYLSPEQVLCRSTLHSKKRALETLSQLLSAVEPEHTNAIYDGLLKRERLGSTAMGQGIAIPHARVKGLKQPEIAAITLIQPIEFDTPDDQPVDIIVGLAVPEDSDDTHLEILANLAALLKDATFVQQLKAAQDNATLYRAFAITTAIKDA